MDELAQMMTAAWAPLDPYASLGFTRPVTPPLGVTGADPERTEEIEEGPPFRRSSHQRILVVRASQSFACQSLILRYFCRSSDAATLQLHICA